MEFITGEGEYPRDPAITRAIRAFDPGIIPLWCRWIFLSPHDTGEPKIEVFGRHAIGHYNPYSGKECFGSGPGRKPNVLDVIWEGSLMGLPDPRAGDLPGLYLPWDASLVGFLQAADAHNMSIIERVEKFVRGPVAEQTRLKIRRREEREYINADLRRFANKMLERVGTPDMEERMALNAERSTRAARSENVQA